MRVAIIDMGTNTFNLLIARLTEGDFHIVHNSKIGVALGMGGIHKGIITPEAELRAAHAFQSFLEICAQEEVENIRVIATSAVRDAKNGLQFVERMNRQFDIRIDVVDGIEEANLIYKGVSWNYNFHDNSLIMDIGGGSTEFIRVEKNRELQYCSLNIGVSRAIQLFQLNDPLSDENQKVLINWFESQATPLNQFDSCKVLVGASGSFETFYEMNYKESFPSVQTPVRMGVEELMMELEWLITSTFDERDQHPFILPIRKKMAPIAALKTKWIIEKFGIREFIISPASLKEGVLRSMFEKRL